MIFILVLKNDVSGNLVVEREERIIQNQRSLFIVAIMLLSRGPGLVFETSNSGNGINTNSEVIHIRCFRVPL